ncbi:MAG: hypothetical protein Q4G59_05270 [Planctomycetia bacterium]|nr:hypothetical protein [Planctomycetia bacterium]
MSQPVVLWAAGLLILTCTLFGCARRKYLRKKKTLLSVLDEEDVKWQQRAVLSSELLEKFERRAGEVLAEHRRLDAQLANERKNLQGLIDEATKTMDRLKGLIEVFEKAYYDDSQGQASISGVFKELQDDFMKKMADFASAMPDESGRESYDNSQDNADALLADESDVVNDDLFGSLDGVLDEIGLSDSSSDQSESGVSKFTSGSDGSDRFEGKESANLTSKPESSIAKPGSTVARSRQVRKLYGQGKTADEIAAELNMNVADVEVLVRVLGPDRRVA